MLSVSPLIGQKDEIHEKERDNMPQLFAGADDFSFDDINFDDLFIGIDEGDILPDLEVDPEMLGELSATGSDANTSPTTVERQEVREEKRDEGEESESRTRSSTVTTNSTSPNLNKGQRTTSAQAKLSQGKRKVKVDWTPDLHRRFVQAVEQLGIDKAVPSRILELMGIDCLTRHNIASHLQKYRSHRKHLLAKEVEAATFNKRRQIYGGGSTDGCARRDMSTWVAPTIGFPPSTAIHPYLLVWGHPTVDQPLRHLWPKHIVHSPSSPPPPIPPPWAPLPLLPPPPPPDLPPYWHPPYLEGPKDGWAPSVLTQAAPCYPQPLTTTRYTPPLVPGVPPHAMFRTDNCIATPRAQTDSYLQFDSHPSKETIDAALGDVLAKPWLPLPLGLNPPSTDSVLVELHCQGISKIPPPCA